MLKKHIYTHDLLERYPAEELEETFLEYASYTNPNSKHPLGSSNRDPKSYRYQLPT